MSFILYLLVGCVTLWFLEALAFLVINDVRNVILICLTLLTLLMKTLLG